MEMASICFFFFKTTDSVSASLDTVWYLEKRKKNISNCCRCNRKQKCIFPVSPFDILESSCHGDRALLNCLASSLRLPVIFLYNSISWSGRILNNIAGRCCTELYYVSFSCFTSCWTSVGFLHFKHLVILLIGFRLHLCKCYKYNYKL